MSSILITGGAGFIGSYTAAALNELGHDVRVLDNLDPQIHGDPQIRGGGFPDYMSADIECIKGDVRSAADMRAAIANVEHILHLAAHTGVGQSMVDSRAYYDTNCLGTATLIDALAEKVRRGGRCGRVVLSSSRAIYGEGTAYCDLHGVVFPAPRARADLEAGFYRPRCPRCRAFVTPQPTSENCPSSPTSVYGWTKKAQEDQLRLAAVSYGLNVRVLRYFNVYGARQSLKNPYTGVLTVFHNRLRTGHPVHLYEGGAPIRDFVHVSDVVRANVLALLQEEFPETAVNIGSGKPVSIATTLRTMMQVGAFGSEIADDGEFRVGDIYACYADLKHAHERLGYQPRVGLEDGIADFMAWASQQDSIDRYDVATRELAAAGLFGTQHVGAQ